MNNPYILRTKKQRINTMNRDKKKSFVNILKGYSKTFWVANTMELFERWAFYGFFMLFANYLTASTDTGALGLSQTEKGIIMGVGTFILYLLPVVTGSIADKFGFKKTLFVAYILYFASFVIMPYCRTFVSIFLNYIFLAIGAALFKPIISATVAKTTTKDSSSIGFGIFYMMVNIGAFIGPLIALVYKNTFSLVFYISAVLILVNMITLIFYKEPKREIINDPLGTALLNVLKNIFTALSDLKFVVFLVIVSGFWTMYYQLFFTLSVFITQWVDLSSLNESIRNGAPILIKILGGENGMLEAEHITNMDALFIILFQLVISTIVMRWRPINSMITGFVISSIGMGLTLMTNNVFFIIAAIFIFGIGEMMGSPKITEYIGRIAPKDKVALYMGCSFLPVALANLLAGIVAGPVYQHLTDKTTLLKRELIERGLQIPDITQSELFIKTCSDFNMSSVELNNFLWDKYHPSNIWFVVTGIGLVASISLWLYDKYMLKEKSEN
ncbi:MAG: MFS transporter [Salinivirgaceae bacterium]|nr:MFS transporter [Salinivirgaceae bacterium]